MFALAIWLFPAVALAEGKEAKTEAADAEIETEHIFGFAEGASIGSKGESEIENLTIGSFGRVGSFNAVDNETSFRYGVADHLRLSIGTLTDFYAIHDVPGLADRTQFSFGGLIGEARWNILDRTKAFFGMSLSVNPQWRLFSPDSGEKTANYAVPVTLLLDKDIVPDKFFTAVNLIYTPSFLRVNGARGHDDALTAIVAGTYAITPNIFAGAEIRHENLAENGTFGAHALYVGPSLFYRVSERLIIKAAWAAQIPDFGSSKLDLNAYERHQVELDIAYHF